ncbi:MAG: hypothetical protein WBA75_00255, partial [Sphingopyxis granuli]
MSKVVKVIVGVAAIAVGALVPGMQFLIGAGISMVGSALLQPKLGGAKNRAAAAMQVQIGEGPRQAIVGRAATAGGLVDAFNYGGKYGTDWEVLVLDLADHRCHGLEGFYVNDSYVAFAGDGPVAGYNGQLEVYWRPGTENQTVPAILTAHGPGWTVNDNGAGVSYVVVAYKADDPEAKNPVWPGGRPRFLWIVRGAFCYDARKDSSVGGSGAHRIDQPATWEYSENPIVTRYKWVRGFYACDRVGDPTQLMIGRGLSAIEAPPANVFARANLCDEIVAGEPRYRVGGAIGATEAFLDVEEDFAAACAGTIVQPEGCVEIDPGEARAIVATFTDDDLVVGSRVRWNNRMLSIADDEWANTIIPSFIDPSQKWTEHSAPVRRDPADLIADGGPREQRAMLGFVTWSKQAQRVGEIIRRLGRLPGRGEVTLPPRFANIEEGDWVQWQSARRFKGATYTFRVEAWASNEKWHHTLTLRQISASVYSDTAPLDDGSVAYQPPAPPAIGAPAVDSWTLTSGYQEAGGVRTPALIVTGALDDRNARFVRIEYVQGEEAPTPTTQWADAGVTGPDVERREIPAAAGGTYRVAISYVVDGARGERLILGPVTAGLSTYPDGTPLEDLQPAEPGATDGAVLGDEENPGNITDTEGNPVSADDVVTSRGTAFNTSRIGPFTTAEFTGKVAAAEAQIAELLGTWTSGTAIVAAAQAAENNAVAAAAAAGGFASTTEDLRDEVTGLVGTVHADAVAAGEAASVATAKAAAAGESESSAAASASVSANYAEGARRGAVATMPSTFEQDGAFWSYLTGSETTAVRPEDAGYPITYPTTQDGKVLRVNNSTGYTHVSQRRRINLASVKGRRFRIRVKARLDTPPATGTVELRTGLYALTENFSQIVYGGYSENITGNQYVPMTGAGLYEASVEFTISNSIVPDGNGYLPVWSTFGGYLFNPVAPNLTGIVDFISIEVDDITESQAAKAQAGIAADQAAIATAAGAAATDSKNITAAYRDDVLNIAGNFDFSRGIENWNLYADHTNGGINDAGTYFSWSGSTYFYRPGVIRLDPNVQRSVFNKTMIPIDPSREYEFSSFFGAYADTAGSSTSSPPAIMYVGFVAYDAAGNILDHGAYGSYRYCLAAGTALAHNETLEPSVIVTGEGNDSWTKFPPGTRYIRLMAIMNYLNVALNTYLDYIKVEDVTESKAAAAHASIANSSAAVAEAARSAAQQSAKLAASIGQGFLNPNAGFDDFLSASVGEAPTGWGATGAPTHSLGYRVADPQGGFAWRLPSAAGAPDVYGCVDQSDKSLIETDGYYVVEADIILNTGALTGAGVLFRPCNSTVTTTEDLTLPFATTPDNTGAAPGAGVLGRSYKFRKLFRVSLPEAYGYTLFNMSHWVALGDISAANDITWLTCGVRAATPAEIRDQTVLAPMEATVSDQAAVLATHDTMLATRVIRTQAGPTSAEVAFHSLASGGGAASQITIRADEVALGDMTKIALKVRGGDALFSGNINAGGGIFVGDRAIPVALQSFPMEVYDGQAVSYGASLGNIPDIVADFSGFAALPAGQSYVFRAEGHTPSGFTARVKTLSSATLATATNTGATTPGTGPTFQMHKADARDAYNGRYTFVVTGSMYRVKQELIEPPETVYQGYVALRFWVRPAGASSWTDCGVKYVGASPGPTGNYTYTSGVQVDFGGTIGLDPTNTEFGVSFEGGWSGTNTLTGLNSVSYQYQVSGSETTATPGN